MVLLFDVNGTLLDTQALTPEFERLFGTTVSVREWFSEVLQHSLVLTTAEDYKEMSEVAAAVLKMTAARLGKELSEADIAAVQQRLTSLPPFPDVKPALEMLKAAGHRLAVLTNSSRSSLAKQLANAGLSGYFEEAISVDQVRRYKPAPETYHAAAEALRVSHSDLILVAAHGWDVYGAIRAGCRAAFVSRPGQAIFPLGAKPDYIARDLGDLAQQLAKL